MVSLKFRSRAVSLEFRSAKCSQTYVGMRDPKIPGLQNVWANQKNSRATFLETAFRIAVASIFSAQKIKGDGRS